jgi:molybdopterin converting factor small subunit
MIVNSSKKIKSMATVIIPTPLRKFTNNTSRLDIKARNVQEVINDLSLNFPELKKHLLDEKGGIRSFVNIFVGDDDIRNLQQEQTEVKENTVISIVPAIAGGNTTPKPSRNKSGTGSKGEFAGSQDPIAEA